MFKNQKGITLIALVITIIVLLILAGITIALITSNESAPNKAGEAKIMQDVGEARDQISVNSTSMITNYYEKKFVETDPTKQDTTHGTALAYINTNKDQLETGIDTNKVTVTSLTVSGTGATATGTIVITSKDKNTSNKPYVSTGTLDANGGISWVNGWQS